MAIHTKLTGLMEPMEKLARVVNATNELARSTATGASGSIYIPNGDGTGTLIGEVNGVDETGTPIGRVDYLGDTTPPSKPIGVVFSTGSGKIDAFWDGTLLSGMPSDFAYVEFHAGDKLTIGRLVEMGSVSCEATVGQSYDCYAVAVDVQGNVSEVSDKQTIKVTNLTSEAAAAAQAAKEQADKAANKAETLANDLDSANQKITEVSSDLEGIKTTAENAITKADESLKVSTEAQQTAQGVVTKATQAYENATEALNQASSATQTATEVKQTLESSYVTKDDAAKTYSTKTELSETADSITLEASEKYATKESLKTYATKAELSVESDKITSSVAETYTTKSEFEGLEIGGTNLTSSTSSPFTLTHTSGQNYMRVTGFATNTESGIAAIQSGGEFTLTFNYSVTGVDTAITFRATLQGSASGYNTPTLVSGTQYVSIPVGNSSGVYSIVFKPTSAQMKYGQKWTISLSSGTGNASMKMTISKWKLEKGNKATTWSPAPEDLATTTQMTTLTQTVDGITADITTAQSGVDTLNTLVRATSNGVEVARKVNGSYTSTKTIMNNNSVNITDKSGTVLASYGSTATIGKSNAGNVYIDSNSISMRNGSKTLGKFSTKNGYTVIESTDGVKLCAGTSSAPAPVYLSTPTNVEYNTDSDLGLGVVPTGQIGDLNIYGAGSKAEFVVPDGMTLNGGYVPYGAVLYSSSTGSNGTITLSDKASNYDNLEVFYRVHRVSEASATAPTMGSVRIHLSAVPYYFVLQGAYPATSAIMQFLCERVKVTDTQITRENGWYINAAHSGNKTVTCGVNSAVGFFITKVIGWKDQ